MIIHNENKYDDIWGTLDQLSPAAGLVVTLIHLGKIFSESGDKEIFRNLNLSVDEFETLFIIKNHKDCRPIDITGNSVMQPAKITRVLDRLDEKGLIVRESAANDRRSYTLKMTEEGHHCLEQAESAFVESTRPLIDAMGLPSVEGLNRALRQILVQKGEQS